MSLSSFAAIFLSVEVAKKSASFSIEKQNSVEEFKAVANNQKFLDFIGQSFMPGFLTTNSRCAYYKQQEVLLLLKRLKEFT